MKQLISMTLFSTVLFLLLSSCTKDTSKPNKEATEYFPNKVGNYWEYEVYDSTSSYPDVKKYTVKVSISGVKKLLDDIDAYIWQYEYPWGNDTNYVRIVGDTIKIFDRIYSRTIRDLQFPRNIFLIPFHDGQRWDGKLLAIDSSHVVFQPAISSPSESFTNGFKIYRHYLGPNLEYNDSYYFIPKIGMVKIYYDHYDLGPPFKILWQLKKYYLQ